MLDLQILRVLGLQSTAPQVLAFYDGYRVRWLPRTGWTCACAAPECRHVRIVRSLIDPKITGEVST